MYITLVGAFGRDYKNKQDILADWLANKDFIIATEGVPYSGKPMNMSQATETHYNVRYANNRKLTCIKKKGDTWVLWS